MLSKISYPDEIIIELEACVPLVPSNLEAQSYMAKQNKAAEKNSIKDGRIRTKPTTVVEQSDDLLGLVRSPGEFSPIGRSDSVQTQATRLGDLQLQNIQRQELATRIGQTQGNQHLGRVTSAITDTQDERTPTERRNISSITNHTNMPIQLLRSGSVDAVHYNEDPRDVISFQMSYQIGEFETILENINRVVQQFGSSSRTYTNDTNFQLMLRSFSQEIGHPSISGGGPVMTRQRWLRLRIRLVRGERRRINRLELLRPRREVEVETPEVVEGRQSPEPRPTREPAPEIGERAPAPEQATPTEQEGILGEIASGAETVGNLTSGRWIWDPITSQLAGWEAELDQIGEQGSPTILGSVLLVPVSTLFVVLQSIVGLLDLLARLNPLSLAMRATATSVRAAAGQYTREDFMRDALEVGDEALDIITLGLRNAYRHLMEGIEEGNAFRITQAVSEVALAALAIFGVFRAIRVRSSAGRMASAVAEERATPAAPTEQAPAEPVRPTAPTEQARAEPVRPSAPTEQAPAEPVRPTAPTEPAAEVRTRQPGRSPEGTPGRPRVERVFNTEEVARQVRDQYMSGEARGGWDAAYSQESLQAHWEGVGERGRPPLAFVDTNGHLIFDARRLGMPPERMVAEGTARRMARRPPPSRIQEPVRSTAPTEQAPAAEPVRPTAPTEQVATAEPVRSTAPTEQAATVEPVRSTAPTEQAATAEPVRPTAPTEQAATAEPVRPTAPTEHAATAEPVRSTAPTEHAATVEPVRSTAPTEHSATAEPVRPTAPTEHSATAEPVRPTAPTEHAATAEPARPTTPTESAVVRGRPRVERIFNTEEVARQVRDQYMSGEARGGWDAAFSQESLQAHWEGVGEQGRPPMAFVDTNGHLVFDARRVGLPQEGMVAEGTSRRMARRPPPPSNIREEITDVNRARQLVEEFEQQGLGINRKPNARVMQGAWEHAGGEGTAPVAYINRNGGLVVNMSALRSQ